MPIIRTRESSPIFVGSVKTDDGTKRNFTEQDYKNLLLQDFTGTLIAHSFLLSDELGDFLASSYEDDVSWQPKSIGYTLRYEVVSAVPLPAALPLFASALGLIGFLRMKRART